ncbi:hypothetical protein HQQ94_00715 [Shewanella sp. VB17]|uniref:hypothetical protein n=1 Tax=Shewanella sp. VB17 TaxID=2739432 RepID=UPI001567AEB5|nr:hypothetical protein [Shewanella sp. VB17]NRD71798.1 hypothetical protein [Shewanella sp. VB17]
MKLIMLLGAMLSTSIYAASIDDYRFYYSDYSLDTKKEDTLVYILKNDPCIIIEKIGKGEKTRYCKLGDAGFDLESEAPSVYATRLTIIGESVEFIAAAPWNEQFCEIDIYDKKITCKPTGKK